MKKQLHYINCKILLCFFIVTSNLYSQPTLLKDIYPGPESSNNFHTFLKLGNKLLFTANDGVNGYETWLTDGTTAGTIRMNDNLVDLNETHYYFRGGNVGQGIGKTNGTAASTVLIKDGFTYVSRLTEVGGIRYFVANVDTANMNELWKTDGTTAGTVVVKKLRPNSYVNAYTTNLLAAPNGTDLYFTANDGTGMALWKSDGTTAGTTVVKYFANTPQHKIGNLVNYNNETYFWAYNSSSYQSLWKTNGTTAGTVLVQQKIEANLASGNIIVYNNKIYFQGIRQLASTYYGWELWVSDGTDAGTYMFFDISPDIPDDVIGGGNPTGFKIVNNLLLFKANRVSTGHELWITDGTANGTFILNDVFPGTTSGVISYNNATNELNKLFFTGFDGNQRMLWETDGTVAGTVPLYDISESDLPISTSPGYINDRLLFMKETIAYGNEIWSFDAPSLSNNTFENKEKTILYPNPVSNILNVETLLIGNYQLKIVNQLGQVVLEQNNNTASISLDVSNLFNGIYFLKITSENNESQTIKFIKH